MNIEEFYQKLAEILDVETVKPEDALLDFSEWDSLSVLSVLAMADASYGVTITPEDIRLVVTAGDLAALVEKKQKQPM
jgi:acyl carrier protein